MGLATEIQMAADDVGIVSTTPMTTAMTTPMTNGVASVANAMKSPSRPISLMKGYAAKIPANDKNSAPRGIRIMSSFVLPAYSDTISMTSIVATYAPMGLPGAPSAIAENGAAADGKNFSANAPTMPATAAEKIKSFGFFSACAMPTPIPAPIMLFAMFEMPVSVLPK